jgi:hypothetical protein
MPRTGWTPSVVPFGADQTVYLVMDSFGANGSVYRETEVERTDLETLIDDLVTGQFNNPIRIIAFNTLEHWSDDVSVEIATEIQTRCDIEGVTVPEHIRDFVDTHAGPAPPTDVAACLMMAAQPTKWPASGIKGIYAWLH